MSMLSRIGARRLLLALFVALVLLLQGRLWFSEDGYREVMRLTDRVATQKEGNESLRERNARLEAEVDDLKSGFAALEERARYDLGMIGADESFYLFGAPETVEAE